MPRELSREREIAIPTILLGFSGREYVEHLVAKASQFPADGDGHRLLLAGTILTKDPAATTKVKKFAGVGKGQTVTITGGPTGGTFTLTYKNETTAGIAFNANAAAVQTALLALPNVPNGGFVVTGGPGPATPYVVTAAGPLVGTDVGVLTADGTSLTGGTTPTVTVTQTAAGETIIGIAGFDIEFWDGSAASDQEVASYSHNCVFWKEKIIEYATYSSQLESAFKTSIFRSQ